MRHYQQAARAAIEAKKQVILDFFDTPDPKSDPITEKLTEADLTTAARAAVALDALIKEQDLNGLAYYYEADPGSEMRALMTNLIVGNSLFTGGGFPMCGEYDLKNCLAMLIFDRLGIGGSFAEFHPVDFVQDTVLVGHDGPHHLNIADGKPVDGGAWFVDLQLPRCYQRPFSLARHGHGGRPYWHGGRRCGHYRQPRDWPGRGPARLRTHLHRHVRALSARIAGAAYPPARGGPATGLRQRTRSAIGSPRP
jgi:hypothetical protein